MFIRAVGGNCVSDPPHRNQQIFPRKENAGQRLHPNRHRPGQPHLRAVLLDLHQPLAETLERRLLRQKPRLHHRKRASMHPLARLHVPYHRFGRFFPDATGSPRE